MVTVESFVYIYYVDFLPLEINLEPHSKYINLGDWVQYYTYGVFDGESVELKKY